jgi:hypothetical protein
MTKYRKKPVIVDAVNFIGDSETYHQAPMWYKNAYDDKIIETNILGSNASSVKSREGNFLFMLGDYIVRGIEGDIYPVKEAIFEQTYEKVEDEATSEDIDIDPAELLRQIGDLQDEIDATKNSITKMQMLMTTANLLK